MEKIMIRKATYTDLENIDKIFKYARSFMRKTGNMHQWSGGYPQREVLEKDIEKDQLYVFDNNGEIEGVFVFFLGSDPTYSYIEGSWISDKPYGVFHRVANSGKLKGMLAQMLDFVKEKTTHLRIDTHEDNSVMQHVLEKNGFTKCGIIYLESGDPRLAYEKL